WGGRSRCAEGRGRSGAGPSIRPAGPRAPPVGGRGVGGEGAESSASSPPTPLPRSGGEGSKSPDPLAVHEGIAYDWLSQGGKRSRPFITLATYDALKGAPGTASAEAIDLPDPVRRVALALEAFHK